MKKKTFNSIIYYLKKQYPVIIDPNWFWSTPEATIELFNNLSNNFQFYYGYFENHDIKKALHIKVIDKSDKNFSPIYLTGLIELKRIKGVFLRKSSTRFIKSITANVQYQNEISVIFHAYKNYLINFWIHNGFLFLEKDSLLKKISFFKLEKIIVFRNNQFLKIYNNQKVDRFKINKHYITNKIKDMSELDHAAGWNEEVYKFTNNYMKENNFKKILDFGCGNGEKLEIFFNNYITAGVEKKNIIKILREKKPKQKWYSINEKIEESFDVVLCCDVIEHVANPDKLINQLKKINSKVIIISTPDRNKFAPYYTFHPTIPFHVREWNFYEFKKYLSNHFKILNHFHVNNSNDDFVKITQIVVCKNLF